MAGKQGRTNVMESLNTLIRSCTRSRKAFPNESALEWMFQVIREVRTRWHGVHNWKPALLLFQVLCGEERVPLKTDFQAMTQFA